MTIEEALREFIESHRKTISTLNELRTKAKEEGASVVQEHVKNEKFELAQQVIRELDKFTKISYSSNVEEIVETTKTIFQGIEATQKEKIETRVISSPKQTDGAILNNDEKELLEWVATTGVSRWEDLNEKDFDRLAVKTLSEKKMLHIEELKWGEYKTVVFELTERGSRLFNQLFGRKAINSFKEEIKRKYGSMAKGFFLYELENALNKRGFLIHTVGEEEIEVSKDEKPYHLSYICKEFSEQAFFTTLNERNELKNIGFICVDHSLLNKAKKATEKWTSQNESRCRFLSVHFATIQDIEQSMEIFETLSY